MANGSLDSRQSEKRQLSIAISAMIVAGAKEGTDRQSNRSAATATAAPMIPVGGVPTDLVKNE